MKTLRLFLFFCLSSLLCVQTLSLTAAAQATQPGIDVRPDFASVSRTTQGGLHKITFDTLHGRVIVNLPDDVRAGDTISGTVLVEPKGTSDAEVQKNSDSLSGTVLEWMMEPGDKTSARGKVLGRVNISTFGAYHFKLEIPGGDRSRKPIDGQLKTILTTGSGSQYFFKDQFVWGGYAYSTLGLHLPTMGQQGGPVEIQGPFDGSFANTKVRLGEEEVRLLAESPRKLVFESPRNSTGPTAIQLDEAGVQTQSTYRNLEVRLSAPKTNLLKGEKTELKVEVSGLQGIKEPVPLRLESRGVITMEGGMYQPLVIQPSQVGADGRYSTTRGITGVQAGGWGATATVVTQRFDFCLRDDSNPGTVVRVNSFTGNYLFTLPDGTSLSGKGSVVRNGCDFTLTDDKPSAGGPTNVMRSIPDVPNGQTTQPLGVVAPLGGRLFGELQVKTDQCIKTGSASVETSSPNSPKVKFTIRDRNTTDEDCDDQ